MAFGLLMANLHSDPGGAGEPPALLSQQGRFAPTLAEAPPAAEVRREAPAGLDIKAVDPQEIAISVIAEIVLWRNADMRGSESRRQGEIRPA